MSFLAFKRHFNQSNVVIPGLEHMSPDQLFYLSFATVSFTYYVSSQIMSAFSWNAEMNENKIKSMPF